MGRAPVTATWPNFIIAGAPKAGTTALYEFLRQHPQVYVSPIKEPTYFARADLATWRWRNEIATLLEADRARLAEYLRGPMTEWHHHRMVTEEEQYLALFRDVRDERAIGEGSVSYFWLPSAPPAIAKAIPRVRLVFMLRDPAERFFSQYLAWAHSKPGHTVRDLFEMAQDPDNQLSTTLKPGLYGTCLARFLEVLPKEQMRFYLYEDFRTEPGRVLRDLFGFLGVNAKQPIETSQTHNPPALPRLPRLHALRQRFLRGRSFMGLVPSPFRPLARRLYHRDRADIRLNQADRGMLIGYYRNEVKQTEALIGRDLSAWLR